jgi:hypothetical protein
MTRLVVTALVLASASVAMTAQDAVTTLPDSYLKQFENEWVRIVRVRYAPYATLPAHAHNSLAAAYVYLHDGGPVLFKHIGTSYGAATRPPTKAGAFRVFKGIDEIHEVENTSELPSEFLRVEFKTDPKDVRTLKGRFFREPVPAGQNVETVQFENDQIRITRIVFAPLGVVRLSAPASEPALLIALADTQLRHSDGRDITMSLGQERWLAAGSEMGLENRGQESSEFLRFDFKTTPLTSSDQR